VCVGLAWLVCGYVISVPIFYDWDLGLVWSWVQSEEWVLCLGECYV